MWRFAVSRLSLRVARRSRALLSVRVLSAHMIVLLRPPTHREICNDESVFATSIGQHGRRNDQGDVLLGRRRRAQPRRGTLHPPAHEGNVLRWRGRRDVCDRQFGGAPRVRRVRLHEQHGRRVDHTVRGGQRRGGFPYRVLGERCPRRRRRGHARFGVGARAGRGQLREGGRRSSCGRGWRRSGARFGWGLRWRWQI